jgi:membrane protease subunit HflC
MRSERERVASEIRSEGRAGAINKRAEADKDRRILLAEAQKEAKRIKGQGDAKAVEIYAEAYNQSPEFFAFYRSLEAYKNTFNDKDDILVLKPDSEFFKFFKNIEK